MKSYVSEIELHRNQAKKSYSTERYQLIASKWTNALNPIWIGDNDDFSMVAMEFICSRGSSNDVMVGLSPLWLSKQLPIWLAQFSQYTHSCTFFDSKYVPISSQGHVILSCDHFVPVIFGAWALVSKQTTSAPSLFALELEIISSVCFFWFDLATF